MDRTAHILTPLIAKLKQSPKKIVFTEGTDPRILEASARLLSGNYLTPVLVGVVDEVKAAAEEYGFTLEAFTYPDEFAECDGSAEIAPGVLAGQQARKPFGFSCRTLLGNDTANTTLGYKLHIVYGAVASPSERSFSTTNDNPEAITFSWECDTTPVNVTGHKPTSCLTIDSTKCDATKLKALEDILYGTEAAEARLPLPDEIIDLMKAA